MLSDLSKPIMLGAIVLSVVMLSDLNKPIILGVIVVSDVMLNVLSLLVCSLVLDITFPELVCPG